MLVHTLENYLDYHILDVLGHRSKCLDSHNMGLDILGLDHLGIIPPANIQQSLFSSIAGAGCTIEDVPMSTYTNWPLGSCAIYSP